jgi:cell division protein FtsB
MNKKKLFVPIAVTLAVSALFLPGYIKIRKLRNNNLDLMHKNRRLQAENILLEQELLRIENDRVYQEQILRSKLDVVKKDEVPVKIVTDVMD